MLSGAAAGAAPFSSFVFCAAFLAIVRPSRVRLLI
jgi:hypothetical protein